MGKVLPIHPLIDELARYWLYCHFPVTLANVVLTLSHTTHAVIRESSDDFGKLRLSYIYKCVRMRRVPEPISHETVQNRKKQSQLLEDDDTECILNSSSPLSPPLAEHLPPHYLHPPPLFLILFLSFPSCFSPHTPCPSPIPLLLLLSLFLLCFVILFLPPRLHILFLFFVILPFLPPIPLVQDWLFFQGGGGGGGGGGGWGDISWC